MGQLLTISPIGLKLIKTYEGFRASNRLLVSGQRVVGYGHRVDGHADITLTKASADRLLKEDLAPFESMIHENVHAPLTQSQFDALCSLAFNIGPKAFLSSEVLHALNNGRILDAANGFDVWRKSNIDGRTYVVDALVRRRTAEKALFLRPEGRKLPASRIDLPPQADGPLNPNDDKDSLPVFTQDDAKNYVTDAPYDAQDYPARRRDDRIINPLENSEIQNNLRRRNTDLVEDVDDEIETSQNTTHIERTSALQSREIRKTDTSETEIILSDDDIVLSGTEFALEDSDILVLDTADAVPTKLDKAETIELDNIVDTAKIQSPIAEAAAEVADQLDALFDDPETREQNLKKQLLEKTAPADTDRVSNSDDHSTLNKSQKTPKDIKATRDITDELQENLEEPLVLADDKTMSYSVLEKEEPAKSKRVQTLENSKTANEASLKDSSDKYIQRDTGHIETPSATDQGPYAVMMVFGLTLIGGFLMTILLGPKTLLGENGPMIAAVGFMIGVMIFTGALYYFLSAIFQGRRANKG